MQKECFGLADALLLLNLLESLIIFKMEQASDIDDLQCTEISEQVWPV